MNKKSKKRFGFKITEKNITIIGLIGKRMILNLNYYLNSEVESLDC